MHMEFGPATVKTGTIGAAVLHLRHFTIEVAEVVSKGEHEILSQHLGVCIFNISIGYIAVQALVLVQEIITG